MSFHFCLKAAHLHIHTHSHTNTNTCTKSNVWESYFNNILALTQLFINNCCSWTRKKFWWDWTCFSRLHEFKPDLWVKKRNGRLIDPSNHLNALVFKVKGQAYLPWIKKRSLKCIFIHLNWHIWPYKMYKMKYTNRSWEKKHQNHSIFHTALVVFILDLHTHFILNIFIHCVVYQHRYTHTCT